MSVQNTGTAAALEQANAVNEPAPEFSVDVPKRKKSRKILKLVIILAVVAVVAVVAVLFFQSRMRLPAANLGGSYVNYEVSRRDITLSLSGTGSLKPADSYTVTTLISGEILGADFEEGDIVNKDTVLYSVDSSNVATSIEQAQNSLSQTQRGYNQKLKQLEDLKIKAGRSGKIVELLVEEGDKITVGQTVARIRDSGTMSLTLPFGSDDASGFYVGQSATVTLDGSFESLTGTISKISSVEERLDGNMLVRMVTIDVVNPGGISPGLEATAMVGTAACNTGGVFSYKGEATVTASASGEVSRIHIKEGDTVSKNQVIVTLDSETLRNEIENSANSLRDSELNLENKYDQLDNYTIKSPISGTIIEKHYKEGDTLESGKVLCTIFDLSYLTMTLNVDELDVSKVEAGQKVTITAEALPGKVFEGYVTKVNINGTTSNGVTSYPVTIRIDKTDGLLPGMNVQASITVSESGNTVAIPVSALQRGNRVLVKTGVQNATMSGLPEGVPGVSIGAAGLPEGFEYMQVTPGISDDEFIEILDGLKEGDVIAYVEEIIQAPNQFGFMVGGAQPSREFTQGGQVQTQGSAGGGFRP